MTERQPPGKTFATWFDKQIRDATERGRFDNLPSRRPEAPGGAGSWTPALITAITPVLPWGFGARVQGADSRYLTARTATYAVSLL